jgi:hypothetical protein
VGMDNQYCKHEALWDRLETQERPHGFVYLIKMHFNALGTLLLPLVLKAFEFIVSDTWSFDQPLLYNS